MKKTIYLILVVFLIIMGCSKVDDVSVVNLDENQLKSARTATPINTVLPYLFWDNTSVLQTALFYPPVLGSSIPDNQYSYSQFPSYDYSQYLINGETEYNPTNYDVMLHFVYFSPEDVYDAVVEFTFPQIKYFVPHITNGIQASTRIYTVNNVNNQTIVTCITDL